MPASRWSGIPPGTSWPDRTGGQGPGVSDVDIARDPMDSHLSPEERARLARKGEILYGKSCGTSGRGTCAESFAVHQLRLGHVEVARDLLRFLDGRIAALRREDPDGLLPMTEALAARISQYLAGEP
jgi:hypothetical protein